MKRETQIELLHELFGYLDARSTAQADAMMRNPVSAYTDIERWRSERELLFLRRPVFMGLSCLLPRPGDYRVEMVDRMPVLLVRDRDNSVKAFANVCRHRGASVAAGCGTTRAFVCPYHGWSYGLDGRLLSITDDTAFAGFDRDNSHLIRLKSGEKHGMIFVQAEPAGATADIDVDDHLAGLGGEFEPFGFAGYSHFRSQQVVAPINWKFAIDTFLEAYHIAFLHKATVAPIFFGNLAAASGFGPHCRMSALRRSARELRQRPESEWDDALKHVIVLYTIFPSTMLIYQADHVETWRVSPSTGRVDECTVEFALYTPTPANSDKAMAYWTANFDLALRTVLDEDFTLGAQIQKGFFSGAQSEVVYGRNEPALIHFHRGVRAALGLPRL